MGRLLADAEQQIGPALTAERHRFVWDFCGDTSRLLTTRRQAAERFFTDYSRGGGSGWYVCGELFRLPFATSSFDLALCSHLLFFYSRELGLELHLHTLLELVGTRAGRRRGARVSDDQPRRHAPPHVEACRHFLERGGARGTVEPVSFKLRRGAIHRFHALRVPAAGPCRRGPSATVSACRRPPRPAGSPGPVRLLGADRPGFRWYKTAVSG